MKIFAGIFLLFVISVFSLYSQNDSILNRNSALKLFISDDACDLEFLKHEITFVNYVRDRTEAQVYILASNQNTGSGGTNHLLFFIGQKEFVGKNDTISYSTRIDATADEIRNKNIQMIKIGLIPYVAKTPMIDNISISYDATESKEEVKDKWNSWVFQFDASSYLNGEKSYSYFSGNSGLSASRITEKSKIEISTGYYYNKNKYDTGDEIIESVSKSAWGSLLIVKSLTNHWSAGISLDCNNSTYSNIDFSYNIYPAIEYNIFPYSESSRKQIRIKYNIGFESNNYTDTTIYLKTKENLLGESLGIAFKTIQKWGSISMSVSGENYLHDFSKNSLYTSSTISLKIVKGLSFNLSGSYYFIHNQISLRKEGASVEEILLSQRQLATSYSYYCSVGLQYTFGSIFNNVVNPRFGN